MKTIILTLCAVFAATLFATSAAAQAGKMYQYTDENGTIVFTDKKPVDREAREQSVPDGPALQGDNPYADAATNAPATVAQQRREEIARHAEQARQQQSSTRLQCMAWQEELQRIEPHRRQFYTNEDGETVRVDDQVRADRVAELKDLIADNCR